MYNVTAKLIEIIGNSKRKIREVYIVLIVDEVLTEREFKKMEKEDEAIWSILRNLVENEEEY